MLKESAAGAFGLSAVGENLGDWRARRLPQKDNFRRGSACRVDSWIGSLHVFGENSGRRVALSEAPRAHPTGLDRR